MRPPTLARLPPSRSISMCGGNAAPIEAIGEALPKGVLPMVSSLELKRAGGRAARASIIGRYASLRRESSAFCYPPGRMTAILEGG
jgi:hypothetical protein